MVVETMLAASLSDYTGLIIAVLGGGGIIGAVVAFLKVRPEAGQIAVTASEGALNVQIGVINTLRQENESLRKRIDAVDSKLQAVYDLKTRVEQLEHENGGLRNKNERLRRRVVVLERQVRDAGLTPEVTNGD